VKYMILLRSNPQFLERAQEVIDNLRIPTDAESAFAFGVLSRFAVDEQGCPRSRWNRGTRIGRLRSSASRM